MANGSTDIQTQPGTKYQQVEHLLLEQIQDRQLRRGVRIPSEPQLSRTLGVSRETIRRALSNLVRTGVLQSRQGYGHIVKSVKPLRPIALMLNRDLFAPPATPFVPLLLKAVRQELHRHACRILLYGAVPDELETRIDYDRLERDIRKNRFVGLLSVGWPHFLDVADKMTERDQKLCEQLDRRRIPLSLVSDFSLYATTGTDYDAVGYMGTRHFLDKGVTKVGLLTFNNPVSTAIQNGYLRALAESSLPASPHWIVRAASNDERCGYDAFKRWWPNVDHPSALVVGDDLLAKGAMIAATALGASIPHELEFASLFIKGGNTFFPCQLVRLEVDPEEYARQAVRSLLNLMEDPTLTPRPVRLRPRVMENGD